MTGEQLKKLRLSLGLTQLEMANQLGYQNFVPVNRKEANARPVTRQDEIILELKYHDALCKLNIYINA